MKTKGYYKAIVIGGSAGSFPVVSQILSSLDQTIGVPVFLGLHRLKTVRHGFVEALSLKSNVPVVEPLDKTMVKKGVAYLAPSNYHMMVELNKTISLSTEEMVHFSRPSIDVLFDSVSYTYGKKAIGIMLSGANKDGATGMKKIKERNGLTIVQDPKEAKIATMPTEAIKLTEVDYIEKTDRIVEILKNI